MPTDSVLKPEPKAKPAPKPPAPSAVRFDDVRAAADRVMDAAKALDRDATIAAIKALNAAAGTTFDL